MNDKIKLLFILDSLRFGGAEKQTIDLMNRFDVDKFELYLCYFRRQEHLKPLIDFSRISGSFCLDKAGRFDFSIVTKMKRVLKEVCPDVVMAVASYQSILPFIFRGLKIFNFRLAVVTHTTVMPNFYTDTIARLIFGPIANSSDKAVFVCKNQMDYWVRSYGVREDKACFIYNGIDTSGYGCVMTPQQRTEKRHLLGVSSTEVLVVICAALRTEKRHVDLVDAAKILVERGRAVKVLIVGDGVERDNIARYVKASGMSERVKMLGYQSDVKAFLELADIVVLCSVAVETFSIAILEGMAFGKPIVTSDIGGASEQVFDGINGYIFPPNDCVAMADRIEAIINNNLFEDMGKNSRRLVCEKFDVKKMVDEYQDLVVALQSKI